MSSTNNPTNVKNSNKSAMAQSLTQKPQYSWVQYFLWLVAGSEISILKECPTDYNKHASIGAAILMTTFLAFCAGSYAGYYFSDSLSGAVIFGFIWALLIFTIDRGMVVTLKKDKDYDKKNVFQKLLPALPRIILALLIAFFIAIPLELLIFKENIDIHMVKYKINQTLEIRGKSTDANGIPEIEDNLATQNKKLNSLQKELDRGEPNTPEFLELKEKVNKLNTEVINYKKQWESKRYEAYIAYRQIPKIKKYGSDEEVLDIYSRQYSDYQQKNAEAINLEKQYKSKNNELNEQKNIMQNEINAWKKQKNLEKNSLQTKIDSTENILNTAEEKRDSTTEIFDSLLQNSKGFVLRYTVLTDLSNFYSKKDTIEYAQSLNIFILLWLIRFIFIVIEILPIFTKIFSPFGAYDKGLLQLEEQLEKNLHDFIHKKMENELKLKELRYQAEQDMMNHKLNLEKQMYEKILNEASQIQLAVAQKKIEEFKKKHLNI